MEHGPEGEKLVAETLPQTDIRTDAGRIDDCKEPCRAMRESGSVGQGRRFV